MKQYLVILGDKCSGGLSRPLLEAHVAHLRALGQTGSLVICGPLGDGKRAIQLFRASSQAEIWQIVQRDPFVKEKYYRSCEIQEFIEGNEENNWLMGAP